jgi:hypothetical protein
MARRWQGLLSSAPALVAEVDSDHYAFLRPPLVAEVAGAIRTWRGAALEGRTHGS